MTIVVEDGTIVAGANSYVTITQARDYASARGAPLSDLEDLVEQQLIQAMDFLESYRDRFKGIKTDPYTQSLQWPRYGVCIDGTAIESDVIPTELKNAQISLAMAINGGVDLMPTATGAAFVIREKVGPIETQYSEAVSTSGIPIVRTVEVWLAPLLRYAGALATERA